MILSANGKEIEIRGKNIKVSVKLTFEREDLSGGGSSSDVAPSGIKPKTVSVGLVIPKEKPEWLQTILKVSTAIDKELSPLVYTVADEMCEIAGIREVIFVGDVSFEEADNLRAWSVSFALREKTTPAEAEEERTQIVEVPPEISGSPVKRYVDIDEAVEGIGGGIYKNENVYNTVLASNQKISGGAVT